MASSKWVDSQNQTRQCPKMDPPVGVWNPLTKLMGGQSGHNHTISNLETLIWSGSKIRGINFHPFEGLSMRKNKKECGRMPKEEKRRRKLTSTWSRKSSEDCWHFGVSVLSLLWQLSVRLFSHSFPASPRMSFLTITMTSSLLNDVNMDLSIWP